MNSGSTINSDKKIRAEKKLLRLDYKARRLAIPAEQRMQTAESVARHLFQLPEWQSAAYVAGYWATQGEVPLHVVQMRLQAPQVWCLPVIQRDMTLKFAPWRSGDDLVSNQYGIPEPDIAPTSALDGGAMSIVLVPLLAYTASGLRLGMGGGFYDRSFAIRHSNPAPPLLVGIAYSDQQAEALPSQEWDVKLDMLINEREVLRF